MAPTCSAGVMTERSISGMCAAVSVCFGASQAKLILLRHLPLRQVRVVALRLRLMILPLQVLTRSLMSPRHFLDLRFYMAGWSVPFLTSWPRRKPLSPPLLLWCARLISHRFVCAPLYQLFC